MSQALVLIGNPNVGKSLLFGCLTNRYVNVSNYPGTTVEITSATATIAGQERLVIDTPGTNGLIPHSDDERVARDILLNSPGADVMQVGDMSNVRRALLLSLQIAEHEIPFSLCLNMSDEARERDCEVDTVALSRTLGVPVVATSALRRWNLEKLKRETLAARKSDVRVAYPPAIEEGIVQLQDLGLTRGVAVAVLSGDETLKPFLPVEKLPLLDTIRAAAQSRTPLPLSAAIANARVAMVDRLIGEAEAFQTIRTGNMREWIGAITMHPIWGVPVLALVLYVAWLFVGNFGAGYLVDLLETKVFEQHVNVWVTTAVNFVSVPRFVRDVLVGPYGIVTMALTYAIAIVLPVVITFFFFFGLLEDSGYLPRLAVMLNRIFRKMGLNGKAVLPMVLGLGCDTMATLTTRILETKKETVIVTLLLALGVPCSAQLGVIMAMLGPLAPPATAIWLGVTGGTIFLVGYLASKVVKGQTSDFILEIPPVRMPKLSNIAIKVAARTEWYLKEAVPLFIIGTLVLYILDAANLLGGIQRGFAPIVVGALGLPAEASNAFLIGFLRRDYGAAGLFAMQQAGTLSPVQTVVALTTMTLFIPCIANFLVILKERGVKTGMAIAVFILVYAFGIGWALNTILRAIGANLA